MPTFPDELWSVLVRSTAVASGVGGMTGSPPIVNLSVFSFTTSTYQCHCCNSRLEGSFC
jgi:hypothetical protein